MIVGDSITAGYNLPPDEAYPAVLQEKIKAAGRDYEVVNAGVSGDTTAGGLRRIAWVLEGTPPVIVVIALGGNDGLRGLPVEQVAENLRGMIRAAREANPRVRVVLAGMRLPDSMGAGYTRRFGEIFPAVAKEEGVAFVPFLLEGVGGESSLNQPDMIHPTAEGQRKVADNVWTVLRDLL